MDDDFDLYIPLVMVGIAILAFITIIILLAGRLGCKQAQGFCPLENNRWKDSCKIPIIASAAVTALAIVLLCTFAVTIFVQCMSAYVFIAILEVGAVVCLAPPRPQQ